MTQVRFHERVAKAGSFVNLFDSMRDGGLSVEKEMEKAFAEENGLFDLVGLKIRKVREGSVEMSFNFNRFVSGRNGRPRVQGGVIMYALDIACTLAVMTMNRSAEQSTVELKTNFLRPLVKDPFTVGAKIVKSGRVFSVSEGEVLDSANSLCARSLGTWFISRSSTAG
jgi:uncharacterized protein (TIGR00369 family)